MKEKIKRYLMLLTMVVGMLLSTAIPVSAYTGGAEQQETVETTDAGTGSTEDTPLTEEQSDTEEEMDDGETAGRVQGTSFSIPGNGQLVDNFSEDETKQFLTIQSKSGNTYFMVLDYSNNTENVYMLSMIDENDLAEFISDGQKETEQEQPSVVIPETEYPSVSAEQETDPVMEEEKGGMNTGVLLAVVLLLVGGIGFYYFKVLKPRQEDEESDGEDLEFYDDGAYINEDQEGSDEEGEE